MVESGDPTQLQHCVSVIVIVIVAVLSLTVPSIATKSVMSVNAERFESGADDLRRAAVVPTPSCHIVAGSNVSSMPPTNLPKLFATTAEDCCQQCAVHNGCVVAVWWSFFCHMLNTSLGIEPLVPIGGYDVIFNLAATTTTTTTALPTTTTLTTAAPSTASPPTTPVPTTPHLPPPPALNIIRSVVCQFSNSCNLTQDSTCLTTVFYDNVCTNSGMTVSCTEFNTNGNSVSSIGGSASAASGSEISMITTMTFDNYTNCSGNPLQNIDQPANICEQTMNMVYTGLYCDVHVTLPRALDGVVRTSCPNGCNDGGSCVTAKFSTGVCAGLNTIPTVVSGESVKVWCYPQYVVYLGYTGLGCEEPYTSSAVEPIGQQCFLDEGQNHIQNLCGV